MATVTDLCEGALVIDSHNDTIVAHIRRGYLSLFAEEKFDERAARIRLHSGQQPVGNIGLLRGVESPRGKASPIQIDFPKMRKAEIDVGFFAVDVTLALKNHLTYALDGFGFFYSEFDAHSNEAVIVRNTKDIHRAKEEGKPAALLAIEHADGVEGSLQVLRSLYEIGVRSIGLTHNRSSLAADGCLEARDGVGLTRFGVDLVREMNRLGMLVDLAHVSPGAFYHALEVTAKPVIFSHGNARALCPHPRNLDDDQLKALAESKGVIGMSFVPDFIDEDKPDLDRLLDHIDHVCEVAGIDTVGIGSDFDGGGDLLCDALEYPLIAEGLARRNYTEGQISMILGDNTLRVLDATIG